MDIEMGFENVSAVQTPSDNDSPIFTGKSAFVQFTPSSACSFPAGSRLCFGSDKHLTAAYPPTTQSLYPFPTKKDDMDCDDGAYSPETSVSPLSKLANDPVHAYVGDNRYPSNASSIAASTLLQPRTRNTSCAYVLPALHPSYAHPSPLAVLRSPNSCSPSTLMRMARRQCGATAPTVVPWTWSSDAMASQSSAKPHTPTSLSAYFDLDKPLPTPNTAHLRPASTLLHQPSLQHPLAASVTTIDCRLGRQAPSSPSSDVILGILLVWDRFALKIL